MSLVLDEQQERAVFRQGLLNGATPQPSVSARPMVEVRDLRKSFPGKRKAEGPFWQRLLRRGDPPPPFEAVKGVSFSIGQGEIFGLLGPNGAGKTTTIRMLCTLLEPSDGSASIAGYDVARQPDAARRSLGAVLTGERSIYWKLTGRENLEYFAALYHLPPAVARRRVDELLQRLDLAHKADELVERYSSGMKQRVGIAKALLANPPVVLLDEPTVGLDPQAARNLRELIIDIRAEGRTVLITTHYMEEADQLCDRVGIIDGGRIIALDAPTALKRSINQLDIVQVDVDNYEPLLAERLRGLPGVQNLAARPADDGSCGLSIHVADSRALMPELIAAVTATSGSIRHLQVAQPTLEDVFIALTGKQLRD